jgi:hypothetical protein
MSIPMNNGYKSLDPKFIQDVRLSSTDSGTLLKNLSSLIDPVGLPSELAPLYEITMINISKLISIFQEL